MSQSVLLTIARDSIKEVLESTRSINSVELLRSYPILSEPHALFITLMFDEKVRGSSGSLHEKKSLLDAIIFHSKVAAFEDSNSTPITTSEYLYSQIELSLISNLLHVKPLSLEAFIQDIAPTNKGFYFTSSEGENIFLPQHKIELDELKKIYASHKAIEIYTFDVESAIDDAIL